MPKRSISATIGATTTTAVVLCHCQSVSVQAFTTPVPSARIASHVSTRNIHGRRQSDVLKADTSYTKEEALVFDDVDGIGQQTIDENALFEQSTSTAAVDLVSSTKEHLSTSLPSDVLPLDDCFNNIIPISTEEMMEHAARSAQESLDQQDEPAAHNLCSVEPSQSSATEQLSNDATNAAINTIDDEGAPSVKKIIKFAIPAIGVWLCGPILSLIDTSAVGLLSGTAQQASLNPAVAISDYTGLLLAFLFTATTNLVASAQASDRGAIDGNSPKTTSTLITALRLSGFVGAGVGAVLILLSKTLVKTMIGNDAIDPEVLSAAMTYVRIRALGVPAAAIIGSAQSACLGMKDIKSPLYVLLAAAIVNVFGDVLFVGSSHPLIGGAAGAAWATTFSQYAALGMFMKWLRSKPSARKDKDQDVASTTSGDGVETYPERINISDAIMEITGTSGSMGSGRRAKFRQALQALRMSTSNADIITSRTSKRSKIKELFRRRRQEPSKKASSEESFSTRGFLEGKLRKSDLLKLPTSAEAKEFLPYVVPVTTTSVGRVSSYAAMSHVVASSLGTVAMAAQQIVLSLFYCLTPIADSLGLTAQSFVPGIHAQTDNPNRPSDIRQTTLNFYKAGAIFSTAMVGAVACIPFFSKLFTADPIVVSMVNSVAPFLAVFFASHGMFSASEGVLLGQKDLGFLGKSYAAFFAIVPALMLQLKKAALAGTKVVDLTSVWRVFVSYQVFRSIMWGVRLFQLQRRVNAEAQ